MAVAARRLAVSAQEAWSLAMLATVVPYLASMHVLIIRLKGRRPDLYQRLGRPPLSGSPFEKGTWGLMLFVVSGFPDFPARGVRGPLWASRVLLVAALCLMFPTLWMSA